MRLQRSTLKAVAALAPCRAPSQSTEPSCRTYSTAVRFVCNLFLGGPFSAYQPSSATASRLRLNSASNSRQNCLSSSSSTISSTWSELLRAAAAASASARAAAVSLARDLNAARSLAAIFDFPAPDSSSTSLLSSCSLNLAKSTKDSSSSCCDSSNSSRNANSAATRSSMAWRTQTLSRRRNVRETSLLGGAKVSVSGGTPAAESNEFSAASGAAALVAGVSSMRAAAILRPRAGVLHFGVGSWNAVTPTAAPTTTRRRNISPRRRAGALTLILMRSPGRRRVSRAFFLKRSRVGIATYLQV
mmetsp:Transcript_3988/g.10034  ORF Transcript_3988/g.10034 Transcript_3988/m.10034 type:complete len:302 (-) Transcript_3988:45-950(-)